MLARPVRRTDYLLGKWLGLGLLVFAYAVISGVLEMLVVAWATGYVPPHPAQLVGFIAAEGLVLLTLALLLSTRLAGMTGGIIALVLWFIAWIGGILEGIGRAFENGTLTNVGLATRLIIPTDALWRGAVYALEPSTVIATARAAGRVASASPFLVTDPMQPAMLAWILVWVAGILVLASWSFGVREV
jgi:ABC-type transport system involved in multi-copper enzyme maturation permease subunit